MSELLDNEINGVTLDSLAAMMGLSKEDKDRLPKDKKGKPFIDKQAFQKIADAQVVHGNITTTEARLFTDNFNGPADLMPLLERITRRLTLKGALDLKLISAAQAGVIDKIPDMFQANKALVEALSRAKTNLSVYEVTLDLARKMEESRNGSPEEMLAALGMKGLKMIASASTSPYRKDN